MITSDGQVVDKSLLKEELPVEFLQTESLSPPGYDIALKIVRYKDPNWRWDIILLLLLALSLALGFFWGMFVLLRAQTELQQRYRQLSEARDALHRKKELFQVTLLSIGEGLITLDPLGKVKSLNPIAEKITQYSTAKAKGKDLYRVMPLLDVAHREPMKLVLIDAIKNQQGDAIGTVIVLHDITDMYLMTLELEHRAKHDPLTGLVNRAEFEYRLQRAVTEAKLDSREHSLLYLDLDQFKVVNDTCGHLAGDNLLKQCWIQVISATRTPVKASRGVSPPNTFLGVKFNRKILSSIAFSVSVAISNFLGQNRLIRPLVFSFVPLCQLA